MNNITFRLAWRNLWRRKRRTWLTVGAMVFSNIILVFLISMQLGMYAMMIENTLRAQTGNLQVQAPGYKDELKMRQVVPNVIELAATLRQGLGTDEVADVTGAGDTVLATLIAGLAAGANPHEAATLANIAGGPPSAPPSSIQRETGWSCRDFQDPSHRRTISKPVGIAGFKALPMSNVTQILSQTEEGDPSGTEQLLPPVYDELRDLDTD